MDDLKTCRKCGAAKPRDLRHFAAHDRNRDGLRGDCRECQSARAQMNYAKRVGRPVMARGLYGCGLRPDYRVADREAGREKRRAQNARDRELGRKRERRRLEKLLHTQMRSTRFLSWLGCAPSDFRAHIEAQFRPGMTWANRGEVWEIDHIKPFCAFDLSDPDDCMAVNHFSNLRPVYPQENREKGATFLEAV